MDKITNFTHIEQAIGNKDVLLKGKKGDKFFESCLYLANNFEENIFKPNLESIWLAKFGIFKMVIRD